MSFRPEEYYKRFIELQEKLRKSEEERLKLEMKFNEMVRVTREEEQMHYRKLRTQYKRFLDEDRRRQDRNERILRTLERIESRVAVLVAKTERFKLLRQQYQRFLDRIHRTNQLNKPKVPEISKPKDEKPMVSDDGNDIVQTYLKNLSSNKLREMLRKEDEARAGLPADSRDGKYDYLDWYSSDTKPNYANSIADDIMDSIYVQSNRPSDNVKFKQRKEFNNNVRLTPAQPSEHQSIAPKYKNYPGTAPTINEPKNTDSEVEDSQTDDFSESEEILYNPEGFNRNKTENAKKSKDYRLQGPLIDQEDTAKIHDANSMKTKDDIPFDNKLSLNKKRTEEEQSQSSTLSDSQASVSVCPTEPDVIDYNKTLQKGEAIEVAGKVETNIKNDKVRMSREGTEHLSQQLELSGTKELIIENAMDKDVQKQFSTEQPHLEQNFKKDLEEKELVNKTEEIAKNDVIEEKIIEPVQQNVRISPELHDNRNQPGIDQTKQDVQENEQNQVESHSDETSQPIERYDENVQPVHHIDQQKTPVQSFEEQQEMMQQYDQQGQLMQQYDEYGQPINQQYDEHGQPVQLFDQQQYDQGQFVQNYGENAQYDEHGQFIPQYDEHGQLIQQYDASQPQYDENGQLIQQYGYGDLPQYDESGQLIQPQYDESGQLQYTEPQYDESGQLMQHAQPQYDESGQLIQQLQPQYDESGQLIQHSQPQYDESGQLIQQLQPQYDESGQLIQHSQPQYDESGQLIQQLQPQYDENGQLIQQLQPQYDENGQLIQYAQPQYDESGQIIQQSYDEQQYYAQQYEESGNQKTDGVLPPQEVVDDKKLKAEDNAESKKTSNVMEMLDTDSESVKQDTKISHDSDFDFSNG